MQTILTICVVEEVGSKPRAGYEISYARKFKIITKDLKIKLTDETKTWNVDALWKVLFEDTNRRP